MLPPSSSSGLATLTLLTLSLLTLTSAQNQASLPDLSKLPECAQKSATKGIASTSCTLTDFTCICKSATFIEAVGASIASLCSPADQQATLAFANAVCGPLGVNLPTGEIAASASPSASSAAPPAPSPSSSAAGATETYAPPSAAAAEDVMAAATTSAPAVGMASVAPPYPIASNGSSANITNQTALPFEGGASSSHQQTRPLQLAAVMGTVLMAAGAFAFL